MSFPKRMVNSEENFHPLFEIGKPLELEIIKKAMLEKFRWPRRVVGLTGLIFADEKSRKWRWVKIIRAAILTILALYQNGFILRLLLFRGKFDLENSRLLIGFSWMLQAVMTTAFLIYYQCKDQIERIRRSVHFHGGCTKTVNVIRRTIIFNYGLLFCAVLMALAIVALESNWFTTKTPVLSDHIYEIFGTKLLLPLAIFVYIWSMYVWMSGLAFFVSVITALHHELSAFNANRLQKIGQSENEDRERIAQELEKCYVIHVEMANRVRAIDSIFEVYTFSMLAVNVPTAIFSIMNFLLSIQNSAWDMCILAIPDLIFCTLELVGLTSAPAKVHATIREVESIIYGNMRIWKPYNDKVYRLARIFISHANQSNLGITLWGFVVVTKPLILTVISLTVSYLTFVLQVRPERREANGTSVDFTFSF